MTPQNYKKIPFTIATSNNNFLFNLHYLNTLLNVSNQFFQKLNFCRLVWKIVRPCFEFTLDQVGRNLFLN